MTLVTARRLPASSPAPAACESVDLDAKWHLGGGVPVQCGRVDAGRGGNGMKGHGSQIDERRTLVHNNCKGLLDREVRGSLILLAKRGFWLIY